MKSIDKYIYSVIVILNKNQGDFTHGTGKKIKKHSFSRYARCHEESQFDIRLLKVSHPT